jgi:hypothetical protein
LPQIERMSADQRGSKKCLNKGRMKMRLPGFPEGHRQRLRSSAQTRCTAPSCFIYAKLKSKATRLREVERPVAVAAGSGEEQTS